MRRHPVDDRENQCHRGDGVTMVGFGDAFDEPTGVPAVAAGGLFHGKAEPGAHLVERVEHLARQIRPVRCRHRRRGFGFDVRGSGFGIVLVGRGGLSACGEMSRRDRGVICISMYIGRHFVRFLGHFVHAACGLFSSAVTGRHFV